MTDDAAIEDIRNNRDTALDALEVAISRVGREIAHTTTTGPYMDQITKRYRDLMSEASAIEAAATDAVLALPSIMAAAGKLSSLATRMDTVAKKLPSATNVLGQTATILSLGQQIADLIANAQKA